MGTEEAGSGAGAGVCPLRGWLSLWNPLVDGSESQETLPLPPPGTEPLLFGGRDEWRGKEGSGRKG